MGEEKKFLDYEGLVLYDKLLKALQDKDQEVIAAALNDLDTRLGRTLTVQEISTGSDTEKKLITAAVLNEAINTLISGIQTAAGANINSVGTPSVSASTSNGVTTLTFNYLKGATGSTGATGVGISSISRTSGNGSAGTTDTYTITGTNNSSLGTFTVYNGSNGSNGSNGNNGYTPYINSSNYHWMINGSDTGVVALGQDGTNGTNGTSAAWFTGTAMSGTGTKSVSVSGAKAGDMYLNTSTYDVYKASSASSWTYQCNIKGADGTNGTNGTNGTAAGFGTPTATVDANVGTPGVTITTSGSNTAKVFNFAFTNLKGESGTSSVWFTGTAVTGTSSSGISASVSNSKAGDMYLNTSTYNVYKATAANTWGYVCNIKGTDGTNATTTSVFSSSADGLAPAASNANKTTAESAQSNYYLCADGKYRQLPTTAFSGGGTLDVIPIVREIDLTDYPINDTENWLYNDQWYDVFGVGYSVYLDSSSGNFYMLTYNDSNDSYSWTQVTVDWDTYYVEYEIPNDPYVYGYNCVENGVRSNTVLHTGEFSNWSDYYMRASFGFLEIIRGNANWSYGQHIGYSYYPKTTCHVPLSAIMESYNWGAGAYAYDPASPAYYYANILGNVANQYEIPIYHDISEVYIYPYGGGKTINVIFINNTNVEHSVSISRSGSSLITPNGEDITLIVPPNGEGYSELNIYCKDGSMYARAS